MWRMKHKWHKKELNDRIINLKTLKWFWIVKPTQLICFGILFWKWFWNVNNACVDFVGELRPANKWTDTFAWFSMYFWQNLTTMINSLHVVNHFDDTKTFCTITESFWCHKNVLHNIDVSQIGTIGLLETFSKLSRSHVNVLICFSYIRWNAATMRNKIDDNFEHDDELGMRVSKQLKRVNIEHWSMFFFC